MADETQVTISPLYRYLNNQGVVSEVTEKSFRHAASRVTSDVSPENWLKAMRQVTYCKFSIIVHRYYIESDYEQE